MNPIRRVLRSAALFLCVAGAAGPVCAADDLTATLNGIVQQHHLPGMVWATVTPEGVQTGAAGFRDEENKLPFDADSRFLIGSVTKTIVSTGILKLVTDGKLDLDAPARNYIQGLDFDNPWRETSPVTIRNLLDHTSGLNDAYFWQYFSANVTPDTPLEEVFTRRGTPLKVRFRPGSAESYSNQGYTLLGLIIERVTGERFEDYLEREILKPLGMTHSSFHFRTQADGAYHDPNLAFSYGRTGRVTTKPILMRPAGMFTTTTADMGKLMQFLLGDGSVDGKQLIAPALVAARGHPTTTMSVKAGLTGGFGLGLLSTEQAGAEALCHDGGIENFSSLLCLFPKDGKAFFFDTNAGISGKTTREIADAIGHVLQPTPATAPAPHPMAADMKDWEGLYVPDPYRLQTLYFPGFLTDNLTVSVGKDKVVVAEGGRPQQTLDPTGDHIFSAENRTGNSHAFFKSETGDYMMSQNGRTFRKVSPLLLTGHGVSIGLALVGILWILGAILVRAVRSIRTLPAHPLFSPLLSLIAFGVIFFAAVGQPQAAIADISALSLVMAAASLAVPLTLIYALVRAFRSPARGKLMAVHGLAALFVLQHCIVLAYWGLMPVMSWTL